MTTMLSTPILDDAIKASKKTAHYLSRNVNLFERWQAAQDTLVEGLENKKIWNVDFVNAKETISRILDDVLEPFSEPFFEEFRKATRPSDLETHDWKLDRKYEEAYPLVNYTCQLNHAAGRIKKLEKKYMDLVGVPAYVEVLKEIHSISEIVDAVKPFIVKGRKPAENPTPVDLTNTATCAICAHTQKLTAAKTLVHHGFRISAYGHYLGSRVGSCFGVGYEPYEMSCEANKKYAVKLAQDLDAANGYLFRLQNGEITELTDSVSRYERGRGYYTEQIVRKVGDQEWQSRLEREIRGVEFAIGGIQMSIESNDAKIAIWKRTPTYDEQKGNQ